MSGVLLIRDARSGDEAAIHALLWEFAEFEKLTHKFHLMVSDWRVCRLSEDAFHRLADA